MSSHESGRWKLFINEACFVLKRFLRLYAVGYQKLGHPVSFGGHVSGVFGSGLADAVTALLLFSLDLWASTVDDLVHRVAVCPLTGSRGLLFQKPSTNVL